MKQKKPITLCLDLKKIRNHREYRKVWERLCPVEIRMKEKHEVCRHKLGDTFIYKTPYKRPHGVCEALLHVLDLYIWRASLGFPSWNPKDRSVFLIHCPDRKGTVWEIRRKEK